MPPVLQKTIREIHQRLRALETREYTEIDGPASICFEQYILHCDDPVSYTHLTLPTTPYV